MDLYLNGRMLPPDQACLSVFDAGFQHAVGLFETFQVHGGRAFRLRQHLDRLASSAVRLGLVRQLNVDPLAAAVQQVIDHNQLDTARLRLTLTPGSLSLLRSDGEAADDSTLLIIPSEPTVYDPIYFERGVTVVIAPPAANPFDPTAGHKTLNYWQRLRTLRQAAALGAGEAIWLNLTRHLAGGAISNLFLVRDGRLLTPLARGEELAEELAPKLPGALPGAIPGEAVLPGVVRGLILELAEVERRMLSVQDLLDADEVFLTNSSWYVLPVTRVEQKPIGDGTVGPVTRSIRERVLGCMERAGEAG